MNSKPWFFALLAVACDVPVIRPGETGLGDALTSHGDAGCPRGLAVAATDQKSANIGLASVAGQMLSPSILSSASHDPGLTAALGGDLAFPSMPADGDELVLLDRYPKSVLTWVNLKTAHVRAQLSVATGFSANPHDYVPLSPTKAYVTRYDPNPNPGREAFDGGSDLLILDPSIPNITGRIDLGRFFPPNGTFSVHPDRARLIRDRVYLVLPYYNTGYTSSGGSYVAAIDPQSDLVIESHLLPGVSGCAGLDVSPDQLSIAVVCSGAWQGTGSASSATSAIVGLQLTPELSETWRFSANHVGNRAFGFDVAFVDATHVLATQLGVLGPPLINDVAYVIDIASGSSVAVHTSADTPFTLSVGPCNGSCGACFITDAKRATIFSLDFSNAQDFKLTGHPWADPAGLPPSGLAFF